MVWLTRARSAPWRRVRWFVFIFFNINNLLLFHPGEVFVRLSAGGIALDDEANLRGPCRGKKIAAKDDTGRCVFHSRLSCLLRGHDRF
jgi:hypothetical protein